MHPIQWKIAGEQLLGHWERSGISRIPVSSPERIASAKDWLELNESAWLAEASSVSIASPVGAPEAEKLVATSLVSAKVGPGETTPKTAPLPDAAPAPPSNPASPSPLVASLATPSLATPNVATPNGATSSASSLVVLGTNEPWSNPSLAISERDNQLVQLSTTVKACRKCEDIACRRQQTVFGAGPSNAKIVLFGEAPSVEDDRVGDPFLGAEGELLDKILVATGLKREQVYLLNALKCRPPNNRTPVDVEIENCRPFFESQLEIIQPDYIICWGAIAARAVLKSTESIGRLRGRFHFYRRAKVLVTYHPTYLLRNLDAKRLTWEDMKMLMRELGIPVQVPGKK